MKRIELGCLVGLWLAAAALGCDDSRLKEITRIPDQVRITVSPPQESFRVGDAVVLGYVVLDQDGILLEGYEAEWQVPPAEQVAATTGSRNEYSFLQPGDFTWTVSLVEQPNLTDSVTLTAEPVPAELEILVDPEQDYYAVGDEVALSYRITDEAGRQVTGVGASWQAPPAADVQDLGAQHYRFLREGAFEWTVTLDQPWGLSTSRTLRVDDTGPQIALEVPDRGDTIRKDTAQPEVAVRGTVSDDSAGVAAVTVRTQDQAAAPVTVQANGGFATTVAARPGLNVVLVEAVDAAGNATALSRAYHYAPEFFYPGAEPDAFAEGQHDALLTDLALDRGRPADNPPYDPCGFGADDRYACPAIEDVASLLELALNNLDFAAMQQPLVFEFPLFHEQWTQDLAGFAEVSFELEGTFTLEFAFREVSAGMAKVDELSSYGAGVQTDVSFLPWSDTQGTDHPGLRSNLGMTGTLQVLGRVDLSGNNPQSQDFLCYLAQSICNPDPPHDCLYDYLQSCSPLPVPLASATSVIDTPVLAGLDVAEMQAQADLVVGLDRQTHEPLVSLARMDLTLGQGAVDVSALEDLTFNLGTLQFASYELELGTYTIDASFVGDLADAVVEPLIDALLPLLEPVLEMAFQCRNPDNPVCFIVPFLTDLLAGFATDVTLEVADPFATEPDPPLTQVQLTTRIDEILFRTGFGGWLTLAGRAVAEPDPLVEQHADDDLLGVGLLGGCLEPDPGFGGYPTGQKALQLATAIDLANQILFAVWRAGGSDAELSGEAFALPPELGVAELSVTLQPWLPPLLGPCAEDGELRVGWGDVHFALEYSHDGDQVAATGFASLSLASGLAATADGQLLLDGPVVDWSEVEIQSLTVAGQPMALDSGAAALVRQLLSQHLLAAVLGAQVDTGLAQLLALQPAWDLEQYPGIEPGETALGVGDYEPNRDGGRIILNGDFIQ